MTTRGRSVAPSWLNQNRHLEVERTFCRDRSGSFEVPQKSRSPFRGLASLRLTNVRWTLCSSCYFLFIAKRKGVELFIPLQTRNQSRILYLGYTEHEHSGAAGFAVNATYSPFTYDIKVTSQRRSIHSWAWTLKRFRLWLWSLRYTLSR